MFHDYWHNPNMLSTVLQDVIFGFRHFRRSIGFSATVISTLALGAANLDPMRALRQQ